MGRLAAPSPPLFLLAAVPPASQRRSLKPWAVFTLCFVLSASGALADVGIGLKWSQESAIVPQDTISCITYGLYNPFDTDVEGRLSPSTALAPLTSQPNSDGPVPVPQGTPPERPVPRRICFAIPVAYPPGGLGPLFPSQSCPPDPDRRTYTGEVSAVSKQRGAPAAGVGSATGTSVAAPLKLIVGCTPYSTDFGTPADLALYGAVGLVAAGLFRRYRKPPEVRRQEKAERLRRQLEKLQGPEAGRPGEPPSEGKKP